MRRTNSEQIGDLLRRFLREQGIETPLMEHRAVALWPQVAGPAITRLTGDVSFRNGTLYVKILRPALRQDLMMGRTELCRRLNAAIGSNVVEQILFY